MSLVSINKLYEEFVIQHPSPPSQNSANSCQPSAHRAIRVEVAKEKAPDNGGDDAAAASGSALPPHAACQTSLVPLNLKDLKRILKQLVVSSLFKLLTRHESRVYARERWLMKRLKKSLGKFERAMTSMMTKTAEEWLAPGDQTALDELPPQSASQPVSINYSNYSVPNDPTFHSGVPRRNRRHQTVSMETGTTCVPMLDSETAFVAAAGYDKSSVNASKYLNQSSLTQRMPASQLILDQRNCSNAFDDHLDNESEQFEDFYDSDHTVNDGDSCLIPRRVRSPVSKHGRHASQSSTRTTFSVDSLSESAREFVESEPAYSGFNIAPSAEELPFPRFSVPNANCNHGECINRRQHAIYPRPPRQYPQSPKYAPEGLIYGETPMEDKNVNAAPCNPWREAPRPRKLEQRQQQHQKQLQRQQKLVQQLSPSEKAAGSSIYSPGRPVNTRIHRAKPGPCQCHAAAAAGGEDAPKGQKPPQQPRCQRCPSSQRRRSSKRQQQQQRKKKRKGGRSSRRQPKCQPGEVSCGDCQPPRIALCPAKRGKEQFSRIQLQTQPGKFITRQVLFFDGSYLFKPVRPKCY